MLLYSMLYYTFTWDCCHDLDLMYVLQISSASNTYVEMYC